jgi:ElaB/YqjD/DUF883 family membrane-anchored ribosome-binding protein
MAERIHRSSDVPAPDNFPGSPLTNETDRLLERRHSQLEQRAADLGAAAGKVVFMVKQARTKVENLPHHPARDQLNRIGEATLAQAERLRAATAERAHQWTEAAREKTSDFARLARARAQDLGRQAKAGYSHAKDRANHIGREYPLHVALAAGAAGFLLGVGLRIRRANRAH